jgi:hypothetical protein
MVSARLRQSGAGQVRLKSLAFAGKSSEGASEECRVGGFGDSPGAVQAPGLGLDPHCPFGLTPKPPTRHRAACDMANGGAIGGRRGPGYRIRNRQPFVTHVFGAIKNDLDGRRDPEREGMLKVLGHVRRVAVPPSWCNRKRVTQTEIHQAARRKPSLLSDLSHGGLTRRLSGLQCARHRLPPAGRASPFHEQYQAVGTKHDYKHGLGAPWRGGVS